MPLKYRKIKGGESYKNVEWRKICNGEGNKDNGSLSGQPPSSA